MVIDDATHEHMCFKIVSRLKYEHQAYKLSMNIKRRSKTNSHSNLITTEHNQTHQTQQGKQNERREEGMPWGKKKKMEEEEGFQAWKALEALWQHLGKRGRVREVVIMVEDGGDESRKGWRRGRKGIFTKTENSLSAKVLGGCKGASYQGHHAG